MGQNNVTFVGCGEGGTSRMQERGMMKCFTEVYGESVVATPDGKSRK